MEQYKIKLLCEIESFLDPENENVQKALERAERYIYENTLPDIFNPTDRLGVEVSREGTFEGVCMSLSQKGVPNPEQLTVYQFYKRVEIIYEQSKPKESKNGRNFGR